MERCGIWRDAWRVRWMAGDGIGKRWRETYGEGDVWSVGD